MISIDTLSDDVLLDIFDFCVDKFRFTKPEIEGWQSLVHVCRRWRSVVFGSPRRLDLHLVFTDKTHVREMLDVWPPLPVVIRSSLTKDVDNIVAALEHRDRVGRIHLFDVNNSPWEKVSAKMQGPFPELTFLALASTWNDETLPDFPDSFMSRSVPVLQGLCLHRIPFPGLPNLLLSATNLITVHLMDIPLSGYIPPEAMVTALSTLTSLESFILQFQSPLSSPARESRRPPPTTRYVLPTLTFFTFQGACEYLDDLVTPIDTPRLKDFSTTLSNNTVFDTSQSVRFISRTPRLKSLETARIVFEGIIASVNFLSRSSGNGSLQANIIYSEVDWQVSFLKQICTSYLPPFSTTKDLYVYRHPHWQVNIENIRWLEVLHPFSAVENLHLCKEFGPRIVTALQELAGSRTTEVLPILQNIFLEEVQPSGPGQEDIRKFVSARELSGHPITVSHWERDAEWDLNLRG